jgi:Fe-S-cluster-containing hydrogenase component 2
MIRDIVVIDEELCDGCGECVPACHEGAIRVVNGKARVISDNLCDGMGACLGHCPRGAIRIERREATPFSETAVKTHLARKAAPAHPTGCPGARTFRMAPTTAIQPQSSGPSTVSALCHWPVQLHLLMPTAPFLHNSDLLVCATCVPVAMPDFHEKLLAGRTVVIACPKLDDQTGYVEKLATMMSEGGVRRVTVARLEVSCCAGLVRTACEAKAAAGSNVPLRELVISRRGAVLRENDLTADVQEQTL